MASEEPTVLVVAPDQAMLRSLTFALEAEGYTVEARRCLDGGSLPQDDPERSCAIVDEAALADPHDPAELSGLHLPVILLVERKNGMPPRPGLSVVEKPPLAFAFDLGVKRSALSHTGAAPAT